MDGDLGRILHVCVSFVSPLYLPFGIVYYIGRIYTMSGCSFLKTCDELDLWDDYLSDYAVYTIYIACLFHGVFWFFALRVVDVMKDGGKFKEALKFAFFVQSQGSAAYTPVEETENADKIEDEDEDVTAEREIINRHMLTGGGDTTKVVAAKGLRKVFKTNEGAKKQLPCVKGENGESKV